MSIPTITFEQASDIEVEMLNLVLTDVARYSGAIDVQMRGSEQVLEYKVCGFDSDARTLTVQAWDEDLGDGAGELHVLDLDDIESINVC